MSPDSPNYMGGTLLQPLGAGRREDGGSCVEDPRIGDIRSSLPASREGGHINPIRSLKDSTYKANRLFTRLETLASSQKGF